MQVLVFAADGFEPIELIAPVDILRRAGAKVTVASIKDVKELDAAHGIKFVADKLLKEVKDQTFDMVVAPGGMPGTKHLAEDHIVCDMIKRHEKEGKFVAAICAAPGFVLAEACKLLEGKKACGYPGTDAKITENGGHMVTDGVTRDGKIITARGPGLAVYFGLALVEALYGKEKAEEIKKGTLTP